MSMLSKNEEQNASGMVSDPAMWSISYQQLMELDERARETLGRNAFQKATMRDINKRILEPHCRTHDTSYALSLNPEGLLVDAFITHAWDEPFAAFVEVCLKQENKNLV